MTAWIDGPDCKDFALNNQIPDLPNIVTFDLDRESLSGLRKALPGNTITVVCGATAESLSRYWNPAVADFLIVNLQQDRAETASLCRFLNYCRSFAGEFRKPRHPAVPLERVPAPVAPLLVLISVEQREFVADMLACGADSCLVLPMQGREVARMLIRARKGSHPGQHALDLDQCPGENPWQDTGGEG
jgi:hypothetical protein